MQCFVEDNGLATASSSAPAASSSSTRSSSQPGAPLRRAAGSSTSDHPHFLKQLGIPAIFSDPLAPGSSGEAGGEDNEDWKALFQQQLELMQVQLQQASELESSQQLQASECGDLQRQRDPPRGQRQQRQADQGSGMAPARQGKEVHPARVIVAPSPLETTFRLPAHTAAAGAGAGVGGRSGGVATAEALCHETIAARSDLLSAKALAAVEVAGAWAQVSVSHGPDSAARKGEGVGIHARPAESKLDHHHHQGTRAAAASVELVHLTASEQQAVLASRAEEFERAWTAVVDRLIVEGQLRARPVGGL